MSRAYYNEIDPTAAAWLRNLIAAGHIAPGDVDERSIEDVRPDDLRGYVQCHFFAGIGVWSHALRAAGWDDSRPAWTGSCPCQPFSAAGKGAGFADERHLWPAWQHLIAQCRPPVIFGEQVASKDADPWIDLVHADLEGMGYAFGCVPFPSAGIGAPHIRDRAYWVADTEHGRREAWQPAGHWPGASLSSGAAGGLADANRGERDGVAVVRGHERNGKDAGWSEGIGGTAACSHAGWLADAHGSGSQPRQRDHQAAGHGHSAAAAGDDGCCRAAGPTNGFWRAADWLGCTDGKWRPVEPGTFPLAHGAPARVGRLRAYGNAISAPAAEAFIRSVMESIGYVEAEERAA